MLPSIPLTSHGIPSFTTTYAVTSYVVTPLTTTEGEYLTVNCPPSCSLDVPCQCTGLGERVTVNISAINCDTQEGAAVAVTIASCM